MPKCLRYPASRQMFIQVVCELDTVPFFWNSSDTRELLVWGKQGNRVQARPKDGIR